MAGKGNIIDNKYEILKEIGHGGMSVGKGGKEKIRKWIRQE